MSTAFDVLMRGQCWALSDGAAGNERQAVALAHALGHEPELIRLRARAPWRWFAPRLVAGAEHAFGAQFAQRAALPPRLAIGCGRQAALALRLLRARAPDCRTVQILDPRIDPTAFDLVIVPAHDALRGDNVLVGRGGLNEVDAAWLARARLEWARFGALPGPRTVVLLGGSNRALRLDRRYWNALADTLEHWLARDGGSLLLSTSRRSPDWLRDAARLRFDDVPGLQWHGESDAPNPYPGFLAWADRIVVTPDSANLLSEACATTAPVLCQVRKPLRGKLARYYLDLLALGRVRPMKLEYRAWDVEPLRDLSRIAAEVQLRLADPRPRTSSDA